MRNSKNTHSANIPGNGGSYHGNGGSGSPLGVYGGGPHRVGGSPLGGVYGHGPNRLGGGIGGGGHYHPNHRHGHRSALMPDGGGYPPAMRVFD